MYDQLPGILGPSMEAYIERGVPPCHFLLCFLSNNLTLTVQSADDENITKFKEITGWLNKYAPVECFGSPQNVARWINAKRKLRNA